VNIRGVDEDNKPHVRVERSKNDYRVPGMTLT
jgi:hypothetical protein